ncbi:hydroxypyruvate isomerase family protein [Primorskyibacter sp. 2E107]|uniref:hydroxypyruvate isomerase family protein n=1 Tax=Primorskyibacter sp. 2E107 TaxID=3403458 RepID=UPI003AF50180
MSQRQFSANLGFLWKELTLPDAIRAARAAGFDAVECHWPYDTSVAQTQQALAETGLKMLGLNTVRGAAGENGLSALPGREADARVAIDQALGYAQAIGAGAVHVMAGFAHGQAAHETFVANLRYAADQAPNLTILIEPLNRHDAPGYFLTTTDQARAIIAETGRLNVKLMFDCYHVGRMEGDITTRFADLLPVIGHVQFASVPDRAAPDQGELNYAHIFAEISRLGYGAPLGAEYKPGGPTEQTLGWMQSLRA